MNLFLVFSSGYLQKIALLLILTISMPLFCKESLNDNCTFRLQYHKDLLKDRNSIVGLKYQTEINNLKHLLFNIQCNIVEVDVPPGRGFLLMDEGEIDVMIAITKNPEREKNFHFIGPHGKERNWLIGQREKIFAVSNLYDLRNSRLTMSLTKSAFYGFAFEELKKDKNIENRIIYMTSNEQKMNIFIKRRVDVTIENEYVINEMVSSGLFDKLNLAKLFLVDESDIYYAFSRKSMSNEKAEKLQSIWNHMN